MMFNFEMVNAQIPLCAVDLLKQIKGRTIKDIVRLLDWDVKDFISSFKIEEQELFANAYGPLLIQLDNNIIIGISSASKYKSLVVWEEPQNSNFEDVLKKDCYEGCTVIKSDDKQYCNNDCSSLIGLTVNELKVIKVSGALINQRGILMQFEEGRDLLISYRLCENVRGDICMAFNCEYREDFKGLINEVVVK